MFYEEEREVVFGLPDELTVFFEKQITFLRNIGSEDPAGEVIWCMLEVFYHLTTACLHGFLLHVQGITTFPIFSIGDVLLEVNTLPSRGEYTIVAPKDACDLLDGIKRTSPCITDTEVIVCSIYCFRWVIAIFEARANIFIQHNPHDEESYQPYHMPLLGVYKAHLFH